MTLMLQGLYSPPQSERRYTTRMPHTVGVVAVQGDYAKHMEVLERVSPQSQTLEVRTPEDLAACDRLILPGGESTTVALLMQRFGLGDAIKTAVTDGMPIWGTCMGMIMLAKEVQGREQYTLDLLDVEVARNAFGAQIHSFEDRVEFAPLDRPVMGVFIRAPVVSRVGEGVEVLSRYENRVVAVRQANVVGTSFHPELTDDGAIHEWFLSL